MDLNIYDNDFEEFLKQKSDQYKMYPSDRVWNNVYSSLHGRKKWWALGFTLFLMGAGLLVGKELLVSNYNRIAKDLNQNTEPLLTGPAPGKLVSIETAPSRRTNNANHSSNTGSNNTNTSAQAPLGNSTSSNTLPASISAANADETRQVIATAETDLVIENDPLPSMPAIHSNNVAARVFAIPQTDLALHEKNNSTSKSTAAINQVENASRHQTVQPSRFFLQYYASPTVSYRRLSNVNTPGQNNVPVASGFADNVNRYVNHKPAPGFELGSNIQYKLSNSLTIFAGVQLNYSRYYIDAFKYSKEKASIALNTATSHDTVSGYTNIRNFSGYEPEQLQNKYLQLSIPVGIEIKLLGQKKLQFSVAGGIQPTFLLSSTSYLISSDYKNYIQSPDLARGFNVHTNFEAFISYKTGNVKWQIGPQFRSQLLSSYSNQYRVREYLTEYGIKFGITKSF